MWESSTDPTNQNSWTTINGETTDNITPETGDVGNYYKVTATYEDGHGPDQTATGETTNAVVDRPATNEHPEFADATATREIAENTPADQNIEAPVAATHPDSVGTLVYSLDATGASSFDIDTDDRPDQDQDPRI